MKWSVATARLLVTSLWFFVDPPPPNYQSSTINVKGFISILPINSPCWGSRIPGVITTSTCLQGPCLGRWRPVCCVLALRNVPLSHCWCKASLAEPAEHIVWVLTGRWWGKIWCLATSFDVFLYLFGISYGINEFLCQEREINYVNNKKSLSENEMTHTL